CFCGVGLLHVVPPSHFYLPKIDDAPNILTLSSLLLQLLQSSWQTSGTRLMMMISSNLITTCFL
ncbi:hypothetical protein MTR67_049691, partial [Solanum verrucosum]